MCAAYPSKQSFSIGRPCGVSRYLSCSGSACLIRVSIRALVRIWRIVRKPQSCKFFVYSTRQWCESHPVGCINSIRIK
jgi:hypothetical protein